MSTSVLNPIMFSEFYKIRPPTSTQCTVRRNLCNKKIDRIKKDLFGPINPLEIKIFEDELHKQQEIACKKWGFDFRTGQPISEQKSNFIWERVPFTDLVPTMYTLSRAAHCRQNDTNKNDNSSALDILMDERANRENETSQIQIDTANNDETDSLFKIPNAERLIASCSKLSAGERQPKITEYMNKRKRLAATPKKLSPPKRLRSNSSPNTKHYALFTSQSGRNKH